MLSTDAENNEVSADERRGSPRVVPKQAIYIKTMVAVEARVRNESEGGACLALPPESAVEIGQLLHVDFPIGRRSGRVCWTSLENQNRKRLVGLRWESEPAE